MICKYCMTEIDDDSVFCESCGSRVKEIINDTGNNDETQLIPKITDADEGETEADVRVSDISKLLSEIYEDEEDEKKVEIAEEPIIESEQEDEPEDEELPDHDPQVENEAFVSDGASDNANATVVTYFEEQPKYIYCMACGKKLPYGAAFCDECGTETGAVSPKEIRKRKIKNSSVVPILKGYFPRPAESIENAASYEPFSLGAGILVAKDILLAVIAAIFMNRLTAGIEDSWIMSGDAFGFAAKVFLLSILTDIILIALVVLIGIPFKSGGNIRSITAACGTGYLLPAILWLATVVLQAFAPVAGECLAVITMVVFVLFIGRAIESAARIKKNKAMYMVAAVIAIYTALLYGGLIWIIG